MQNAV